MSLQSPLYGMEDQRTVFRFPLGARDFSLRHIVHTGHVITQCILQWIPFFFPSGKKRPVREADHLL